MKKIGETENGYQYKILGYYKSYNDAYKALIEFEPKARKSEYTLADIYDEWMPVAITDNGWSKAHEKNMENAWRYITLQGQPINNILPSDIRANILSDQIPPTVRKFVLSLYVKLFNYCIAESITTTNPAQVIKIPRTMQQNIEEQTKHKSSFTMREIKLIYEHKSEISDLIWISIFSGWRPSELCKLKKSDINMKTGLMRGGLKTKAGKDRIVPIHPYIVSSLTRIMAKKGENLLDMNYNQYKYRFDRFMVDLGINGHSPHDCRKTFITLAKTCNMDEYALKRIVGHSIADITESIYTDRSEKWLIQEMLKIRFNSKKSQP